MEMNFQNTIIDPINATLVQLAAYLPAILGALVILIVGWIIAKIIQRGVINGLSLLRLDAAAEHAGLTTFLRKGEIKENASDLVGKLVYWLIMLIVLVTAVNALGLTTASELLDKVFMYLPNVIAAVFVIILGTFLAAIVSGIVMTTAANAGLKQSKMLSDISRYAIVVFAGIIALDQLGIATDLLVSTFSIFVAGAALAFAIAVGLGAKDKVAEFIDDLTKKKS
jgi:Mechanosensitive ion channel, conserved TM helix